MTSIRRYRGDRGAVRSRIAIWVIASLAILVSSPSTIRSTSAVDLVLVLALDVSSSVDDSEFDLQREGIANAFRQPSVVDAILRGRHRRIAVTAVQWADVGEQIVSVSWAVIGDKSSAADFARKLAAMRRSFQDGRTHIAGAIRISEKLARTAPFSAARRVVDISGDGVNTVGNSPHSARDVAVLAGMTINALAITNERKGLAEYYRLSVVGGPGAFVMAANDYDDYARAILAKLLREIDQRFMM